MNIEERAAQAAAWKATGQCNCAQAVMKAFEDKLPVDADTLMSGFFFDVFIKFLCPLSADRPVRSDPHRYVHSLFL